MDTNASNQRPQSAESIANHNGRSRLSRPEPITLTPEEVEAKLRESARQAQRVGLETKPKLAPVVVLEPADPAPVYIPSPESVAEREARERQRLEAKIAGLLNRAFIPRRYAEAKLDDVARVPLDSRAEYLTAVMKLRRFAKGGAVVGLCGSRGPGKTHMACALVLEHCRNLVAARYCTAMDFFLAIKSQYAKRDGDEAFAERQFFEPELLVIDEIQVRGETSWEDVRLTALIDRRYANLKTTVIATNLDKAALRTSAGDSIADRFFDGGGLIECTWQSLRGRLLDPEQA